MSNPVLKAHLDEDQLLNCMRCGFCLPACPTYRLQEKESATPRGRISLLRSVMEGKIELMEIASKLDECLGCRACETACPAGVHYGAILEEGRAELTKIRPNPWPIRFAYKYVLGTPGGIKLAGFGLWFYQVTGLQWLARQLNLVEKVVNQGMADMEKAVPPAASPFRRAERKSNYPAVGPRKKRVGFFIGCISDIVFYETNQNAIEVLRAAGCEIDIPKGQGCCGAVHGHAGEHELAVSQAKRNILAFEAGNYDYISNTAGGCGAALKEYGKLLKNDPEWAERAYRFSAAFKDFSELIALVGTPAFGEMDETFTYQDSCHLRNVQKVVTQPRNLLKAIPGSRYVELPEADRCCGAAGTYAITQAFSSDKLLDHKMNYVKGTGAGTLVVSNPPCNLEMQEGVDRMGLSDKIKVRHIADVLAEALKRKK